MKLIGFNLDKRAIHPFLGYGATVSPNTLDKYIKKVPPSSYIYFDGKGSININEFDTFLSGEVRFNSFEESAKELEKRLLESVEIRIPKQDIKYGALLSGGVDSSLVASMLSSLTSKDKRIKLFSVGYDGYEKYDERRYAKEVADHIEADFYQYNFTKEDFFSTLDELLKFIDDPIGDPAQIPLFFLIKKAKEEGVKVLFSGDGSDELFLGYRQYKEYLSMEAVKSLPYSNWLKNHLRRNFSLNREWEWYKRALNGEVIFRSLAEIYTDRQLNLLLRLQERDGKNFEYIERYWDYFKESSRDIIDWYSYIDLKIQLAEFFLVKVDRVSMANGIEVRSPFLDSSIVKLAFEISPQIRFNSKNPKEVLKRVASKYIPKSIIERKKKGFNYPFIEWILEENGLDVIFKANREFNIFSEEHLKFLSSKADKGKFRQHLFPLFILSKWLLHQKNNPY
jgi:asparagine synthase (glutamine-hydrolysing)